MKPTVPQRGLIAGNALGCALSVLLLISGIVWYPLMVVIVTMLAPAVALLVLGLWFGGDGRIRVVVAFTAGALLMVFGYSVFAGAVARHLSRAWTGST